MRKIRQIIYDWRPNRKFINMLKGRRNVNRWPRKTLRRTQRFRDLHSVNPLIKKSVCDANVL